MAVAPSRRSPDTPGSTSSTGADAISVEQRGLRAKLLFRNAQTATDYQFATQQWASVRRELQQYEIDQSCSSSGAGSDRAIAQDVFNDLVGAPVDVMLSVCEMVLACAGNEKDDFLDALRDAYKDTVDAVWDATKGKAAGKAKVPLEKAYARLREALVQYLQSCSKRSRKHFMKLIDGIAGTLKGWARLSLKALEVFLTPVRLSPEGCALLASVDREQQQAFRRIFKAAEITTSIPSLR